MSTPVCCRCGFCSKHVGGRGLFEVTIFLKSRVLLLQIAHTYETHHMPAVTSRPVERVADVFVLREMFLDAEAEQFEADRRAARHCEHLADVLEFARDPPRSM